jgi:hypothetical protein
MKTQAAVLIALFATSSSLELKQKNRSLLALKQQMKL